MDPLSLPSWDKVGVSGENEVWSFERDCYSSGVDDWEVFMFCLSVLGVGILLGDLYVDQLFP